MVTSVPIVDFLTPIEPDSSRPLLRNLPSDDKQWTDVAAFATLNPSPHLTGIPHLYPSQPWFSGASPSMLVHYDNATVHVSGSAVVWYDIKDELPRLAAPLALRHTGTLSVYAETISGHTVALSNNGGTGVFFRRENEGEDTSEVQFHRIFTSINRQDTPTQCPFVCPLSGTIGYAGSWGDIYVVHQR